MAKAISKAEREDFAAYLRNCTDRQVIGVYEKESQANRRVYANLAIQEAIRRGFDICSR